MKNFFGDFSLYIHIPFCRSKCAYCDFLSFADNSCVKEYFSALCREIRVKGNEYPREVDSIYIGGGTPSLCEKYFPMLKEALFDSFRIRKGAEISVEANPESVSDRFIEAAIDLGVNRVSLGVQSLSDPLLKRIGRAHDEKTAIRALEKLTAAFLNVGADCMVGLPSETREDVLNTVSVLAGFPLSHLSCYSLILEKGTRLYREAKNGLFTLDEDLSVSHYDAVCDYLCKKGFERYEISNFCRNGKVCRYNTSVWQYADYLGFGLGASSFIKGKGFFPARRFSNIRNLKNYIFAEGTPRVRGHKIEINEGKEEFIMLSLRLAEGLELQNYRFLFGVDFLIEKEQAIRKMQNYLIVTDRKVAIKPEFIYVSNSIISELI